MATNHSRDRHGSIFDGAEWDGSWSVLARCGRVRPGGPRSDAVGYENRSCGRHSCVFEDAERDESRFGMAQQCKSSFGGPSWVFLWREVPLSWSASVRLRASRSGMNCGEARWVVLWRANVGSGLLCRGNHHRAGTEADRRGRGGMHLCLVRFRQLVQVRIRSVGAGYVVFRCGSFRQSNHTRAGTVPDQRGRCGMNQGRVRQCAVRLVATRQCRLGCGGFLNHARAGTGLDQRQRRGMH